MPDTEKVSFNLTVVDLGKIDLLVEQGFYSNRTDFLITAVRNQLASHSSSVADVISKYAMVVGVHTIDGRALEALRAKRKQLALNVVGVLILAKDVTPELARATIKSIRIRGSFRATPELREALKDRLE